MSTNAVIRRYTFKLYPTKTQEAALLEQARMSAMLWNALLEMRETFYRRAKQRGEKKTSLTAFDQGKDITALRAALPEWRAQPRGTQERIADMLDLAFKAFWRRAKAGGAPGYPRFKSVVRADSVHLREPAKSCWSFSPSKSESGRCAPGLSGPFLKGCKGEFPIVRKGLQGGHWGEPSNDGRPQVRGRQCNHGEPSNDGNPQGHRRIERRSHGPSSDGESQVKESPVAWPSLRTIGNRREVDHRTRRNYRDDGEPQKSWRLAMRGIPGAIKARGKFPVDPEALKTADIRFHAGAWWFSVAVAIVRNRPHAGDQDLRVDFDLIDEFAVVKTADGGCPPGLRDPFMAGGKGECPTFGIGSGEAPAGASRNEGGGRSSRSDSGALQNGGGRVQRVRHVSLCPPAGTSQNEGDGRNGPSGQYLQSVMDRRFKRGSCRWHREKARVAKIKAANARRRREALHRWTTSIVRGARSIEVTTAAVSELARTGRGSAAFPGAEVATIAALNARIRDLAPAAAVKMLEYKAAECGVPCAVTRRDDHQISAGRDLRAAAITNRRAKRAVKRKEASA